MLTFLYVSRALEVMIFGDATEVSIIHNLHLNKSLYHSRHTDNGNDENNNFRYNGMTKTFQLYIQLPTLPSNTLVLKD